MLKTTNTITGDLNHADKNGSERVSIQPSVDRALERTPDSLKSKLRSGSTKPKRKHPEGDLQISCVRWYRLSYPRYKFHLFAIPNQLVRKGTNAQFLAAQGVVSGTPDLMLAIPRLHYHGLFIEMKAENGVLSQRQKESIERLTNIGYLCKVAYSFDGFMKVINEYLK